MTLSTMPLPKTDTGEQNHPSSGVARRNLRRQGRAPDLPTACPSVPAPCPQRHQRTALIHKQRSCQADRRHGRISPAAFTRGRGAYRRSCPWRPTPVYPRPRARAPSSTCPLKARVPSNPRPLRSSTNNCRDEFQGRQWKNNRQYTCRSILGTPWVQSPRH